MCIYTKRRKIHTIMVANTVETIALLLSTLATWRLPSEHPSRINSSFEIPRTVNDAVSAGWVKESVKQSCKVSTYCLTDDPRYCVLFDNYGHVAGVQPGILVKDVEDMQSIYNMTRIKFFQIREIFNQLVWTSTAYTQDPAVLKRGGSSSKWDNLTGTEGVWLEITDGYVKVARNLTDLDPVWTEQACIPTMGTHYYYNMYNTTACEDVPPLALLFVEGTLSGVVFQVYGNGTIQNRTWYDKFSSSGVKLAIPNGPQCIYDWTATFGLISLHTFFTAQPWTITCS